MVLFSLEKLMQPIPLFHQPHHPVALSVPSDDMAALLNFITEQKSYIDRLIYRHAGILLRATGVRDPAEFALVAEALGSSPYHYTGGNSPRTHLGEKVYTSTEYPATEHISLHNEMSYLPCWPSRLYFHCSIAAASGGQTPLAHAGDVLAQMPDDIVAAFKARKLRYTRTLQPNDFFGKGWKTTYGTSDKEVVEATVKSQGSDFEWLPDDVLRVSTLCDATAVHPVTGQQVWFNQAEQWHPSALAPQTKSLIMQAFGPDRFPHDCRFADGGVIDDETMRSVRAVMDANRLVFDWQQGDILLIDNLLAMHGRHPFTGPRRIHTFLAA